jgi:DNA-binding NarL/FixJ family response regulator
MNATVRVLLGDDHKIVREGLKMVLADDAQLQVVAEADSGPGVLHEVHKLQGLQGIDVVLLDIALPGMDGLDVLQALRREYLPRKTIRGALHSAGCIGLPEQKHRPR